MSYSSLTKTNPRQFEVEILGHRRPSLGEVFEIEVGPRRVRIEVQCMDKAGPIALVEKTDGGGAASPGCRSRVISDRKEAPPDVGTSEHERNWEDFQMTQEIAAIDREEYDDIGDREGLWRPVLDEALDQVDPASDPSFDSDWDD
jgi:hypothetical protein